MRTWSAPAPVTDAPQTTAGALGDLVDHVTAASPDLVLFERPVNGQWHPVTAAEWGDEVRQLALGFVRAGVAVGDRVALMSRTRYEWTLVDFALWAAGAISVPIYETSSAEQVSWILSDSGAVGVVVESAEHQHVVDSVREACPSLRDVWCIDDGAVNLIADGATDADPGELQTRREALDRSTLATIIYTSGTTG
ncbi:MAG: AMP-binding protein, partial [Actinomycetes bacterium]